MTELKREYVVPLRRKSRFAPKWRRSKKAVSVLKDFIRKHMKTQDVIVCKELNEFLWENGAKNPPGKVKVVALKTTISGTEKTLVNLASKSFETQLSLYKSELPVAETSSVEKDEVAKRNEVKESEDKKDSEKSESVDKKAGDSKKKSDDKKEVKSNE